MNNHDFDHEESIFENLMRHEELASITYGIYNSMNADDKLPLGMTKHDVYIL